MYVSPSIAHSELRRLALSKRPHIPVKILAEYVLNYCTRDAAPTPEPGVRDDSVRFLEAMYRLEDPRRA